MHVCAQRLNCAVRQAARASTHISAACLLRTTACSKLSQQRQVCRHAHPPTCTPAFDDTCLEKPLLKKTPLGAKTCQKGSHSRTLSPQVVPKRTGAKGPPQHEMSEHPDDTHMPQHVCELRCPAAKMLSLFMPDAQAHTLPAMSLQGRQEAPHSQATATQENQALEYTTFSPPHPTLHRHTWHTTTHHL